MGPGVGQAGAVCVGGREGAVGVEGLVEGLVEDLEETGIDVCEYVFVCPLLRGEGKRVC